LRGTGDSRPYTWVNSSDPTDTQTMIYRNDPSLFAVRTCQSYFNPQETIKYTNIDPMIEGMSSGATEREDFIITPDLRGQVCCVFVHTVYHVHTCNVFRFSDHWISLVVI